MNTCISSPILHFYSAAAELYRACASLGKCGSHDWQHRGQAGWIAHANDLARGRALVSRPACIMNRTLTHQVIRLIVAGPTCRETRGTEGADADGLPCYSEMFYSGMLSAQQTRECIRWRVAKQIAARPEWNRPFPHGGSPSAGGIFTHIPLDSLTACLPPT